MFAFHQLHAEILCAIRERELRAALCEETARGVRRERGERVMALFMIIDILRQTYSPR